MPYTDKMVDYLNRTGIRTAVISNDAWSGEAIKESFDRLLPNNQFEFIISSCGYMMLKPDKRLFEIALMKSGLTTDKVWYCGDSIYCDMNGAHNAGIFPILYEGSTTEENPSVRDNQGM